MALTLRRISPLAITNIRSRHSALFIPGNKATDSYSFLSPILDFDTKFSDLQKLIHQLQCRRIPLDVPAIKNSWEFYKSVDCQRKKIEDQREQLAFKIKNLLKSDASDSKESAENLKAQAQVLKNDLKVIKQQLWNLEETIIVKVLDLPNDLDDKTPMTAVILRSSNQKPQGISRSHLEIGQELGILQYIEPLHYYLLNEAANFELAITKWISSCFVDSIRVSGTDFARDFVVEASGIDHEDPQASFLLNNSNNDDKILGKLHLVGGSSLVAFLGMHTKQLISPKSLPLRYHSVGRKFTPNSGESSGLFGVCQATAVDTFVVSRAEERELELCKLVEVFSEVYQDLDVHYRVVLRAAHELKPWESLRISFELWSRSQQEYVEVGHLATHGNYFSKRLLIAFQTKDGREYPDVISGTVLNVQKALGCFIEGPIEGEFVPKVVRNFMIN